MKFEEVNEKHVGMIRKTLDRYFEKYDVADCDRDTYESNAIADLWIKTKDVEEVNSSFVRKAINWSCINTFHALNLGGNNPEGPQTSLFSEDSEFSEEFDWNYCQTPVYCYNGEAFPFLPELADLDKDDHAVIQEFLNTPVEDRSRRTVLRRRVDLILLKLGIDSSEIHEYTSRQR